MLGTALLLVCQVNASQAVTDNGVRRGDSTAELSRRSKVLRHVSGRAAVQTGGACSEQRGLPDPIDAHDPDRVERRW